MAPIKIVRNQASRQNLVDSTKLERIKLDSKLARRKAEPKDEKKENSKHKHDKSHHKHSHKHSSSKAEAKKVSNECEQLEKSGLTEELDVPLGYLSDGSQNSKKRKRDDSPPAVESLIKAAPVAGKPLRIRLIFKRPKVDESPCSTSGAVSLDNREKVVQASSGVPVSKVSESLNQPKKVAHASSVPISKVSVSQPKKVAHASSVPISKVSVSQPKKVAQARCVPIPKVSVSVSQPKKVAQARCVPISKVSESLNQSEKVAQASSLAFSKLSVSLKQSEKVVQAVVNSSVPCLDVPELPSTSVPVIAETKNAKKHRPSKEDRYNALFDNWDPTPLCLSALGIDSSNDDGDDWLFGKRTQENLNSRAAVQEMNTTSLLKKAGEVSLWPRAQFLPEVGIHSLPYTVPF